MKIKYLQLSNILSFKHYDDIAQSPKIEFNTDLNILIGQNGSGKSTALEALNFIFKKVLFKNYGFDHGQYQNRTAILPADRKAILSITNDKSYNAFRLDANWDSEDKPQFIRIALELDAVDEANLTVLQNNTAKLEAAANAYSNFSQFNFEKAQNNLLINVELKRENKSFLVTSDVNDGAYNYLLHYNFYKQLINFYNSENPADLIPQLSETFSIIGGYRNYSAYHEHVSLQSQSAASQIFDLKNNEFTRSAAANEQAEPQIFRFVKLRIAEKHYELFDNMTKEECVKEANNEPFLLAINEKLKLVNLEVKIDLVSKQTWQYSFLFHDTKRHRILRDINSLSAGQKSIVHLIFESYGRGNLKGGVVIIDEPEIHLHYQFQHAYLQIVEQLMGEQECQYILVTHSESLINSKTISKVKRFSLDSDNSTVIKSPIIDEAEKSLIKILDNTKSTFAMFAKSVVLVEGDSDRYFWKAVLTQLKPEQQQDIAILDIGGKGNYSAWKSFFEKFGLKVFYIGDFDNVFTVDFGGSTLIPTAEEVAIRETLRQQKLDTLTPEKKTDLEQKHNALVATPNFLWNPILGQWNLLLDTFKNFIKVSNKELSDETRNRHGTIDTLIESKYTENVFILKQGSLEAYTGTAHGNLDQIVTFCTTNLETWLATNTPEVQEVKNIIELIMA